MQPTRDGPPRTPDPRPPTGLLAADPATLTKAADGLAARQGRPPAPVLDHALLTNTTLGHPTLLQALCEFADLWDDRIQALAEHGAPIEEHLRQTADRYRQADTAAAHTLTPSGSPHVSSTAG